MMTNAQSRRLARYAVRDLRIIADDLEEELRLPESANALRALAAALAGMSG